MRIIAIAGAALALLTIPVSAQQPSGGPPGTSLPGMKGDKPKPEEWHPSVKADEKAYKSALELHTHKAQAGLRSLAQRARRAAE